MDTDVIIVGAGPVGLLLANLLGQQGVDTVVVDRKPSIHDSSRAIGITPPSLALLEELGIIDEFIGKGVKVEGAFVHGPRRTLGTISFRNIQAEFRFILSIPQRETEGLLLHNLEQFETVRLLKNREVYEYGCDRDLVYVKSLPVSGHLNKRSADVELRINGQYLCACDGFKSTLRDLSGISWRGRKCRDTFLMADFTDRTTLNNEAHLFFTPEGSVESFPLPRQKRRWVIQTDTYLEDPSDDFLIEHVKRRSGYDLSSDDQLSQSSFRVYTYIMKKFHSHRMIFLGDAAHTISPIGGQGMNTGFADAGLAAWLLPNLLRYGYDPQIFSLYTHTRRRAAVSAAKRAILSMKTGTVRGDLTSGLRNAFLKLILNTQLAEVLPKHYAMLTIPFKDVASVKDRYRSKLESAGIDYT